MNIISKIFGRKKSEVEQTPTVGGMEDFMTLIRVYYQAVMASNLGITNIGALPDLRVFKQTLRIATVNNKLGIGERTKCKKMLKEMYGLSDNFFKEIDLSIKKGCKNVNDIRNFLFMFQGFSQDLMMTTGNLMQWKMRIPSYFKKTLFNMTQKTVQDMLTKNDWKDDGVRIACANIRKYQQSLGYSPAWITEYVFNIVTLAKKEAKPKNSSDKD